MSAASRRLARALARFARETSATTSARAWRGGGALAARAPVAAQSVPNARRRVADARAFAASTTRAVGNGDRGGDVGTREKRESARASTSGDDAEVDVPLAARGAATVEELAALAGLEFRTFHRSHRSRADETFGSTMRERWRRTFSNKLAFAELYSNKFEVVKFFIRFYGAPFAAMFVLACCSSYAACMCVSVFGMIGFVLFAKLVGAGDWALSALDFMKDGFQYLTGIQGSFFASLSALVMYRTTYYTLPVVLFAYEELYYFAARFRRFARWLGR
jgi:hypothetical protein